MSDIDILPCYPIPSAIQCPYRVSIAFCIIVSLCGLFLLYFLVVSIKKFRAENNPINRRIASFFMLAVYSYFATVANFVMDTNAAYTNAIYCAQSIPRAYYCISQCMLAEQTATILIMLKIRFSKILKYAIQTMYYIFMVASVATSFICVSIPFPDPEVRADFVDAYVNPFISYAYLIVIALTIVINAIAFVFIPSIYDLFQKKFITLMRLLLLLCSFFFVCFYIVFTYNMSGFSFDRIIIIDHGIGTYIISTAIQNFLAEYIPKFIYVVMMWYLTFGIASNKEANESDQTQSNDTDQVVNQTLVALDNDGTYYFPE